MHGGRLVQFLSALGAIALCMHAAIAGDAGIGAISFGDPSIWQADGLDANFQEGAVALTGSGFLRIDHRLLSAEKVAGYTRLVVDYFFEGGAPPDVGMVNRGFPQTEGFGIPRWAPLDITSPVDEWFTHSYDLALPEWGGGNQTQVGEGEVALAFIIQPGGLTRSVKMRNIRFVRDPFKVKYDWLQPIEPLTFRRNADGTLSYEKSITLVSNSDKPVTVQISVANENSRFSPAVTPSEVTLKPGEQQSVVFAAKSTREMKPLYHEELELRFVPKDAPTLIQSRKVLIAAPAKPRTQSLFTPSKDPRLVRRADAALSRELRMPPRGVYWMSQGQLNAYAAMEYLAFDTFRVRNTETILADTPKTSGALHRLIIREVQTLAEASAATGNKKFAQWARDWFLLYARGGNRYPMATPLSEASSYLCPHNATYIQASVVMGPLMRALNFVWYSEVLSEPDREEIWRDFVLPRAMESMKINPGLTNMQDEINNFLFLAGVTCNDPNLIAASLFGSHGVQKKIDLAFSPDGSTEESVAIGYHNVVVHVVSQMLQAITTSGIETGLDLTKVEKAKTLMYKLAMPNGHVPNRGDTGAPSRVCTPQEAQKLKSVTFDHFGMTVLRQGKGEDAIYVALDHRPPSTTHSHHDKLGIILYGGGHCFGVDDGSLYNIDPGPSSKVENWKTRSAWGYHSLAHNTVTVDRKSLKLAGGHRLYFQGGEGEVQAVGAYTDTAASGVHFERHIAVNNGVAVIVDRLSSDKERTHDLAHHSFGAISASVGMAKRERLDLAPTYNLPEDVRRGVIEGKRSAVVSWEQDGSKMQYQVLNVDAAQMELYTATGWSNVAYRNVRQPAPFLMARKKGKDAVFISVINFGGKPVQISSYKLGPDSCSVDLADQRIVFDFRGGKVTAARR